MTRTGKLVSVFIQVLVCVFLLNVSSAPADPLDTWHWRNPLPQGNHLHGITHGDGLFVKVGRLGTILTSPDGVEWSQQTSGTGVDLRDIVHGDGIFLATGRGGIILSSPDGVEWIEQDSNTQLGLEGAAHGSGQFVLVGTSGTILTSPDGVTWTARESGTTGHLRGIAYGDGQYVAVGTSGTILTSPDGMDWTQRVSGTTEDLRDITHGDGQYVAVGENGTILTSPDGIDWTQRVSGTESLLDDITHGDGRFVTAGENGTILTSPDGMDWTQQVSDTDSLLMGITNGNGLFAAVGIVGTVVTSPDGNAWTVQSSGVKINFHDIIHANGKIIAVGQHGTILASLDGIEWVPRASGSEDILFGITRGDDEFVAVGENGTVLTSPDGVTWTAQSSNTAHHLRDVAPGNGQYVAVGHDGTILTSPDGVNWAARPSGTTAKLYGIAYDGGQFVAVGENGTVLTSPDGTDWTQQVSGTANFLGGIAHGGGQFVVVGAFGTIITSPDAITWTAQSSGTTRPFYDITHGDGFFVVTGFGGGLGDAVYTSPDGADWTRRIVTTFPLYGATCADGQFTVAGAEGNILQSGFAATGNGLSAARAAPAGYRPDEQLTVSVEIEYDGTLSALGVEEVIPAGWTYVSAGGANPPDLDGTKPGGEPHELDFAWLEVPESPVSFTYTVHVPGDAVGAKTIEGKVIYRFAGGEELFFITPCEILPEYHIALSAGPPSGGEVSGAGAYIAGDEVTVTAEPSYGFRFVRWHESGASVSFSAVYTFVAEADRTLVAQFALKLYTLTYNAGAGGVVEGDTPQTVQHGSDGAEVEAVPDEGWHFVQWDDGVTDNPRRDTDVQGDITVEAQFALNEYTLAYTAGSNGVIEGETTQAVLHGHSGSAVEAVADEGYDFVQWDDGVTDNPRLDTDVQGDITVEAQFTIRVYEINAAVAPWGGGTVSGGGEFEHGSEVTVQATADAGFDFIYWRDSGPIVSWSAEYSFVATANRALVAYFIAQVQAGRDLPDYYLAGTSVTVTVEIEYEGSLSALGLTETVPEGWAFADVGGPDAPQVIPDPGADGHLEFAWTAIPGSPFSFEYTLDVPPEAVGGGVFNGVLEYRRGAGDPLFAFLPESVLAERPWHSADYNPADWRFNLQELLRLVQIYNVGSYHILPCSEDGFAPGEPPEGGPGHRAGRPHDSDYNPQDWKISLSELLRAVQIYNMGGYHPDPDSEDGFAPGPLEE